MKMSHSPGTSVAAADEAGRFDAEAGIVKLRKMGRAKNNEDAAATPLIVACCTLRAAP